MICIDTGTSSFISNVEQDFLAMEPIKNQSISGIRSGLQVEGRCTLCWTINNDDGNAIVLHVNNALYVPKVPLCLLCPQQVAKQTGKDSNGFLTGGCHGILTFNGFTRTIYYNGRYGLLLVFTTCAPALNAPQY